MRAALLVLLLMVAAGCASPAATQGPAGSAAPGMAAPIPLVAPTFDAPVNLPGVDMATAPISGEPSIATAPDGRIWVSAPVIPQLDVTGFLPGAGAQQGRVWSSPDGKTFTLHNKNGVLAGKISGDGDTDIAVDGNGTAYMADLGRGIPLFISKDHGATWTEKDDITATPQSESRDRQWIDARGPGRVVVVVAGTEHGAPRTVLFVQSNDSGETWSKPRELTTHMIQIGPIVWVDDHTLAMVYVEPLGNATTPQSSNVEGRIHVLVSPDSGATWNDTPFAGKIPRAVGFVAASFAPTFIFPVIAADHAGNLYVAWSQSRSGSDAPNTDVGTTIMLARSLDRGATWSDPQAMTPATGNSIFPALVAGEEGRVALAWLRADTPLDPNHTVGPWYLHEMETTNGAADAPKWTDVQAAAEVVHNGGVCASGGACSIADGTGDRTLLDFIEIAIVPTTGKTVIAYTVDPPMNAKQPQIHVISQNGGSPLLDLTPR